MTLSIYLSASDILNGTSASKKVDAGLSITSKAKLVINNNEAADFENIPNTSPSKKAIISTTLRLSDAAGSINKREALTEEQIRTVDSLISLADEIKNETNLTKADGLSTEAAAVLTSINTSFTNASNADPNLAVDEAIVEVVDPGVEEGNSKKYFRTTISSAKPLADYGLAANTSFSKSNIDTTTETLEQTRDGLYTALAGYSSSRSAISLEVSSLAQKANVLSKSVPVKEDTPSETIANIVTSEGNIISDNAPQALSTEKLIGDPNQTTTEKEKNNSSQISITS